MKHAPSGWPAALAVLGMLAGATGAPAATMDVAANASATVPAEIADYAAKTYGDVFEDDVFRGDFTGDGRPDAIAFIYYPFQGGNGVGLDVSLFVNKDGKLVHRRKVEKIFGEGPANVVIKPGEIRVTLTTFNAGDPVCCPSGSTDYVIKP
jgi:hypothetical protein